MFQADTGTADGDWRLELMKSFQNVFIKERDLLVDEIDCIAAQSVENPSESSNDISLEAEKLLRKADRLTKVLQDSIAQIKVADRISLISEVKDLRKKLGNKTMHHGDIDFSLMFKRLHNFECSLLSKSFFRKKMENYQLNNDDTFSNKKLDSLVKKLFLFSFIFPRFFKNGVQDEQLGSFFAKRKIDERQPES